MTTVNPLITEPAVLDEDHREALEFLLDGAQRAYEQALYFIKSLTEDLTEAAAEGNHVWVEKHSKKIREQTLRKEARWKEIEALTAALAAIPKEQS